MVDYTTPTGSGGTMMIRDTGSNVEFWIKAGSTNTWFASKPWSWTINGANGSGTFSYSTGAAWKLLGSWNITYNQTVWFNIGNTGTTGLGGPTSMSAYIHRATVPNPPNAPEVYNIANTSFTIRMYDNGNGGAAITRRLVGFGLDPNYPQYERDVDGSGIYNAPQLAPGSTYHVWASVQNSEGWSGYGGRTIVKTHDVPSPPSRPTFTEIKQTSVFVNYSLGNNNGAAITSNQIGYGTSSSTPSAFVNTSSLGYRISGLTPGLHYYFWVRSTNTYGQGAWSLRGDVLLPAGAWVDVNGVKKRAVPYVKHNGVWRPAESFVKIAGMWKGTE